MAKIYYERIKRDSTFTIEKVPLIWRDETQALLDADEQTIDQ